MQKKSCTPCLYGYNTQHMNETPKKRGRPRGSTSFTRVLLSDLAKQLGSEATIVVSKRWLEEIGLTVDPSPVKTETIKEEVETEEKIEFHINTFE